MTPTVENYDLHIVGPFPPPYGGISVHIQRMIGLLEGEGIFAIVHDQFGKHIEPNVIPIGSWLRWLLSARKYDKRCVVHVHFPSTTSLPFFAAMMFFSRICRSKVMVSLHNEGILYASSVRKAGLQYLLKIASITHLICVSERVATELRNCGVDKTIWLPAYVPHGTGRRQGPEAALVGRATCAMNVWSIEDLTYIHKYGVDLFLDLAKEWPQDRFEIFLGRNSYVEWLGDYCRSHGLRNVTIVVGENLVEHIGSIDIFLRPNRFDAYGISIQEALEAGVPSIASDVCTRPKGTRLFLNGCLTSLRSAYSDVRSLLREDCLGDIELTDYHLQLISIYKGLLEDNRTE